MKVLSQTEEMVRTIDNVILHSDFSIILHTPTKKPFSYLPAYPPFAIRKSLSHTENSIHVAYSLNLRCNVLESPKNTELASPTD